MRDQISAIFHPGAKSKNNGLTDVSSNMDSFHNDLSKSTLQLLRGSTSAGNQVDSSTDRSSRVLTSSTSHQALPASSNLAMRELPAGPNRRLERERDREAERARLTERIREDRAALLQHRPDRTERGISSLGYSSSLRSSRDGAYGNHRTDLVHRQVDSRGVAPDPNQSGN